jgi:cell division protein FtsL
MIRVNKLKEPPKESKLKLPKVETKIGSATKGLLGGEVLTEKTFKLFPFLLFIALLAFLYIANNYLAEEKIRNINRLHRELKELRYEYINSKSELTNLSKESHLVKRLAEIGIKENKEPVKTLKINKPNNDQ